MWRDIFLCLQKYDLMFSLENFFSFCFTGFQFTTYMIIQLFVCKINPRSNLMFFSLLVHLQSSNGIIKVSWTWISLFSHSILVYDGSSSYERFCDKIIKIIDKHIFFFPQKRLIYWYFMFPVEIQATGSKLVCSHPLQELDHDTGYSEAYPS